MGESKCSKENQRGEHRTFYTAKQQDVKTQDIEHGCQARLRLPRVREGLQVVGSEAVKAQCHLAGPTGHGRGPRPQPLQGMPSAGPGLLASA